MREIVYSETRSGVFEPPPTRAQKRQAKQAAENRKKRHQKVFEAIGFGLLVLACVTVYAVELWAIKFHMH